MYIHILMRDEEERSKQGQTNNKTKEHSTPKPVTFSVPDAVFGAEEHTSLSVAKANHYLIELRVPVATNHALHRNSRNNMINTNSTTCTYKHQHSYIHRKWSETGSGQKQEVELTLSDIGS